MLNLKELKKEADESCKFRGHKMVWFDPVFHKWSNSSLQDAYCSICGAYVQICDNPQINGIAIGGSAVAMTCPCEE